MLYKPDITHTMVLNLFTDKVIIPYDLLTTNLTWS